MVIPGLVTIGLGAVFWFGFDLPFAWLLALIASVILVALLATRSDTSGTR